MELAVETHTSPRDWWDETDETLATAIAVINERADEIKRASRRR